MSRLILVSNRLPVTASEQDRLLELTKSSGGLATGLSSIHEKMGGVWIGWPGIASDRVDKAQWQSVRVELIAEHSCYPVDLDKYDVEAYYLGFCNKTIWPLFHYFPELVLYEKGLWESYVRANIKFASVVCDVARPGDIVWIHDYQLMLLPFLIREGVPEASIGYFHHIPFPSFELFRLMPWRKELLTGLLGADLIGFHTYDYVKHFLTSVRRLYGFEHDLGLISCGNRLVRTDAFPMGVDYERFSNPEQIASVREKEVEIRNRMGQRKIILSVDRLDYTKGIMERLIAFDLFLKRYPEYKEKVTLIMVAVPSRSEVDSYVELKSQVDELVGRVNGTHGSFGWTPVWYLYRSIPFEMLCALYRAADVALVTPLRDGMNLIAKEFIASRHNGTGVLVLSEMAGAERELGESVLVNPNDAEAVSRALKTALTMSKDEQAERNSSMQERLQRYDVVRWVNDFMERLNATKAIQLELQSKELTSDSLTRLVEEFAKSTKALLLLDYDGTLRSFEDAPGKAVPDDELTEILCGLTAASKNHVVIVSGRDRATLDSMFGDFNIGLISDHGVWIKKHGRDWHLVEPQSDEWKSEIQTIMEHYVDRTPGSFVEEKDFSLVFHYRKADPELAETRVRELTDDLIALTARHNVRILEGNRALELTNADVNKGRGTSFFLEEGDWDFILAVGDDWTDEDLFAVLPDSAYSFKVGLGPSSAMYCLESVSAVRQLLRHLMEAVGCPA